VSRLGGKVAKIERNIDHLLDKMDWDKMIEAVKVLKDAGLTVEQLIKADAPSKVAVMNIFTGLVKGTLKQRIATSERLLDRAGYKEPEKVEHSFESYEERLKRLFLETQDKKEISGGE